jgi:putative copper export protein
VTSPALDDSLKSFSAIAPKWLTFTFLFVFIGTLALRVLVIGPGRPEVDRLLHAIAGVALLAFIPATVWQLSGDAADAGSIGAFLTSGPDGTLWLIRLTVTALAAVVLLARRGPVFATALALGVSELLARVIPTSAPDDWARELFTQLLDFAHMLGAAIWP